MKVYSTLVRPLLEYASQVWHPGLNQQQKHLIESIQEWAIQMVYPSLMYEGVLTESNLQTLHSRRDGACKNCLWPCKNHTTNCTIYFPQRERFTMTADITLPKVKTNSFKDSFIDFCTTYLIFSLLISFLFILFLYFSFSLCNAWSTLWWIMLCSTFS